MNTEIENDVIDNSIHMPLITLGDYLRAYNRLSQQIEALEVQINMLEKSAERFDTSFFDSALHQLDHELFLRKKEIGPIIMKISCSISQFPNGDGIKTYQHIFLGHSIQEVARLHGTTENSVTRSVNKCLKALIPDKVVNKLWDDSQSVKANGENWSLPSSCEN